MSVNDDVLSEVLSAKVGALRAGAGISRAQQELISELAAELRRRLGVSTPGMVARSADARIRALAARVGSRMDAQLDAFVDQRLGQFHRDWSSLVGYSLNEPRRAPSPDVLGGTARDWMEPSGVRTAIMSSVGVNAQGDVASMLDPLTKFRQDVKATARSGASAAHNAAVLAIARANTSAIRGVVAVATLDARTTELCISRHGASWDVVSGDPLPESTSQESFPGRPPWHFNCRTTLVPVFASFEYPSLQDADKWLSSRAGKAALGPRRVALWEAGRITRNQLIDQDGRPQLIEDLQHV